MTWILDIIAIFFVVSFSIYGLIKGSYYMIIDTVLVLACIAGALVGAYFTVTYLYPQIGIMDGLNEFWLKVLGNSKIPNMQETVETVAFGINYGLLFLATYVIYHVILNALRGLLLGGVQSLRSKVGIFKGFGNLLGFLFNFAVSAGIVLCLMAIIHSFKDTDILRYTNEALQASEVLSLIYDINPLNPLFEGIGASIVGIS